MNPAALDPVSPLVGRLIKFVAASPVGMCFPNLFTVQEARDSPLEKELFTVHLRAGWRWASVTLLCLGTGQAAQELLALDQGPVSTWGAERPGRACPLGSTGQ